MIKVSAVEYHLPEQTLTTEDISREFPEWSAEKIASKIGISTRHISAPDEFSSDLAVAAASKLLQRAGLDSTDVDFLIVCSQTPDFVLPSLAGFVQSGLGLPTSVGAVDINMGCSGFVYALGLAKGMIESGQAKRVLVITADTYTKLLNPGDKSVRTIFGDGASATFVEASERDDGFAAVYGADGSGASSLIVPNGGLRNGLDLQPAAAADARSLVAGDYDLYMDGPQIFDFTLRVVPPTVADLLLSAGVKIGDIDLFVFHQANAFMLEHLRKKLKIPVEKFFVSMEHSGNTVSSTIPIALANAEESGRLRQGMRVMLVGFGVGLSWAGITLLW